MTTYQEVMISEQNLFNLMIKEMVRKL